MNGLDPVPPRRRLDFKKVSWRRSVTDAPPALKMVLPGLRLGGVGVLVDETRFGDACLLALQTAASVACGCDAWRLWLTPVPGSGRVVYLNLGDPKSLLDYRLWHVLHAMPGFTAEQAVEKFGSSLVLCPLYGRGATLPDVLSAFEHEAERASLLILDTFDRVFWASGEAGNRVSMRRSLIEIEAFAHRTGCSVLLVRSQRDDVLDDLVSWQASIGSGPDGTVSFSASARYGMEAHADVELVRGEGGVLSWPIRPVP